jgi:hypothetical protein
LAVGVALSLALLNKLRVAWQFLIACNVVLIPVEVATGHLWVLGISVITLVLLLLPATRRYFAHAGGNEDSGR